MNLYQKINEIKKQVQPLQKDVQVGYGNNSYKAISHDAVLSSVNNLMINVGVVSFVTAISDDTERTQWQELYKNEPKQKFKTFTKVKMQVRFINADNPEEYIDVQSIGHADDPGDKAAGKAYSYAMKYAYLKLFGLKTGENDEYRHDYNQAPPMQQPTFTQPQGNYRR